MDATCQICLISAKNVAVLKQQRNKFIGISKMCDFCRFFNCKKYIFSFRGGMNSAILDKMKLIHWSLVVSSKRVTITVAYGGHCYKL